MPAAVPTAILQVVIATGAPRESEMHALNEIELWKQHRDELAREAENKRLVLLLFAKRPKRRFWRSR